MEIRPQSWYQDRAEALQKWNEDGRDADYGGIFYGFARMEKLVRLQIFLGQAESIATAWRLFCLTEKPDYRDDYLEFWRYAWDHFVDHHMALGLEFSLERAKKSIDLSLPGKTDYHVLTVCWDILENLSG